MVALAIVSLFILGCTTNVESTAKSVQEVEQEVRTEALPQPVVENKQQEAKQKVVIDEKKDLVEEVSEVTATLLASSNYYRFDKAHYEQSLADGKIIFLDFHADWCPICNNERPYLFAAFEELQDENVVGYQVHYKDSNTNDDDTAMAKKYGIILQHTKVLANSDEEILSKSLESFDTQKTLDVVRAALEG